jgi:hypothetical protein
VGQAQKREIMVGKKPVRLGLMTALALILAGCGSSDEELQAHAKKQGMSDLQAAAFVTCASNFRRNKPVFAEAAGNVVMKEVPLNVCACQSNVMLSVFKDDQYKGHAAFAEYMALEVKKRPPRISKKDLKDPAKMKEAAARLETSFKSCISTYKTAHAEESKLLFELLPPKEAEKKDGAKKEKNAS